MARRIYSRVTIALAIGAILTTTPTTAEPVHAKNDPLRQPIFQEAGAPTARLLLTTCSAINDLAAGWLAGNYEQESAARLAKEHRRGANLALAMITERKQQASREITVLGRLLARQANALVTWIERNDRAAMQDYLAQAQVTDEAFLRIISRPLDAIDLREPGMSVTVLDIMPAEAGTAPGRFTLYQPQAGQPFGVRWKYPDCTQDMGLAAIVPDTDILGLSFGKSRGELHVYRYSDGELTGGYVADTQGTRGRSVSYAATQTPNHFLNSGGLRLEISPRGNGFADLVWRKKDGNEHMSAIAIVKDDALVAVVTNEQQPAAVGMYYLNADGTGGGRWLMSDGRNGTEELRLRVEREAVVDTTAADSLANEVREIASLLRQDFSKAARFRPDDALIDAIAATTKDGELLRTYTAQLYAQLPSSGAAAKPGQSEILITGPALSDLPGGYTQQRDHFRDGIAIYGFKYVEPGKTTGMAYDGLIRIGNQWAFIPKAWRAFVP